MYRKLFIILLLISVSTMLSAQVKASRSEKANSPVSMEKVKDVNIPEFTNGNAKPMAVYPVKNNPTGDTIATTIYATFANSVIRHQVKYWKGLPNFCPMIEPNSKGNRSVAYIRSDGKNYLSTELAGPASTNRTGWGAIDIARTGSSTGTVGIVAHTPNTLNIWDPGSSSFIQSTFNPWLDPSIQILGDSIFLSESADRATSAGCALWKTYNYGVSFMLWDSLKNYSPKPIYFGAQGTGELAMFKSDNEKYAAYVGTNKGTVTGAATSPHNWQGVSKDSCDNIWMINTTDKGLTWKGQTIGVAGVSGTLKGYPLPKAGCWFANFQQCQGAVGNDGVFHVITNGYGLSDSSSSTAPWVTRIYPVVYWNSKNGYWKSISKIEIDTVTDSRSSTGDPMTDWRQGNSMGQCWPAISASPDGKVLFVVWTGPQFTNGLIDTTSNVVITASSTDTELIDMYTDIYYAYSVDGGANFTYGGPLPGADKKKFGENFPTLDPILEPVAGGYQAHIMYLEQLPPFALTSGTRPTDNLIYRKFTIPFTTSTNSVTLLSPNGGENWIAGSSHNITWSSNNVSNIKIEYSTNNGSAWLTIFASTPAAANSYPWIVPNSISTQCKVRISDVSNLSLFSISSSSFTISAQLPAPSNWTYVKNFPDNQRSLLTTGVHGVAVDPDGKVWYQEFSNSDTIAGVAVKVNRLNVFNSDASPSPLNGIKIISINGIKDTLWDPSRGMTIDEKGNIIWGAYDSYYKINYKTAEGIAKVKPVPARSVIAPGVDNEGRVYTGCVTAGNPINEYDLSFNLLGNPVSNVDGYGRTMTVTKDGLTLLIPRYDLLKTLRYTRPDKSSPFTFKDNIFVGLSPESIAWQPVTGYLWLSAGSYMSPPADTIKWKPNTWYGFQMNSDGSFVLRDSIKWKFNSPFSLEERPRGIAFSPDGKRAYVGCFGGSGYPPLQEFNNSTIVATSSIDLLFPNGGESWWAGTVQNITWTSSNITNLKIEFTSNNGNSWQTISASAPASGASFPWTIPSAASTLCRVRISDVSNSLFADVSSNLFSILQVYSTVWPGDTNNDGIVDQLDILPLGLFWAITGPARTNAGTNWSAQSCIQWTPFAATYADANGNGTVDQADLLSLGLNFHKTHTALAKSSFSEKFLSNSSLVLGKIKRNENEIILNLKLDQKDKNLVNLAGISCQADYSKNSKNINQLSISSGNYFNGEMINFSHNEKNECISSYGASMIKESGKNTETNPILSLNVKLNALSGILNFTVKEITVIKNDGSLFMLNDYNVNLSVTDIKEAETITNYSLSQNYPNPFNPATSISYQLPKESPVVLKIYNMLGQEIKTLVETKQPMGSYKVDFNASILPSGIYFYKITTPDFTETKKMILQK